MTNASGNNQTQAGKLALPNNHKETGKPMDKAAALALEIPFNHAKAAAKTPKDVAISMATEGWVPCSAKKL
jgi:hypothetical protein